MKNFASRGDMLGALLVNVLYLIPWTLPAWILLVVHFVVEGFPIWPFWVALLAWVVLVIFSTFFMSWAVKNGSDPTPQRENIDPYGSKVADPTASKVEAKND